MSISYHFCVIKLDIVEYRLFKESRPRPNVRLRFDIIVSFLSDRLACLLNMTVSVATKFPIFPELAQY